MTNLVLDAHFSTVRAKKSKESLTMPTLCRAPFSLFCKPRTRMRNEIPGQLITENGRRSISRFLEPLAGAPLVRGEMLGPFKSGGEKYFIPRYTLEGQNSSDPIRIGLFAAIHGDEPAGALAV